MGSLKWKIGPYFLEGLRRDWFVFTPPSSGLQSETRGSVIKGENQIQSQVLKQAMMTRRLHNIAARQSHHTSFKNDLLENMKALTSQKSLVMCLSGRFLECRSGARW